MFSGRILSFVALISLGAGAGCAGVTQKPGGVDGSATGTGGTGLGGGSDARPGIDGITVITTMCGNGSVDNGEQCDDGNKTPGDGCSVICQIPAGWSCTGSPSVCTMAGVCGDGILGATEACDDGNRMAGDGCAANCDMVDSGYECRVPGRLCIPACGDGRKLGGEGCDDANTMDGDGCSVVCQVEPGAVCTEPAGGGKSTCTAAICGNGVKEGNEGCDCGTDNAMYPTGCKGPNGLFFGDATGCSKTCTKEPSCRSATGATQACAITCGNGNVEGTEACDDGNQAAGDGCSPTCTLEAGFMCENRPRPDSEMCSGAECLRLPVIYRDFKSEKETGGHPDFFYLGAPVANPVQVTGVTGQPGAVTFNKRYCVSNSGGPAKQNDSTARCWDLAQANLGPNGKPVFNMARSTTPTMCDCQFTDWSHNGNGGHVPNYGDAMTRVFMGLAYAQAAVAGNNGGAPWYKGPAPIVASKASFEQWFVDSTFTGGKHVVGTMDLAAIGNQQYQFSTAPHAIYGGFFPLDPPNQFPVVGSQMGPGAIKMVNGEAMLCNMWPYWFTGATATFDTANCRGDQYMFPPSITTAMWVSPIQGWFHNFYYTTEVRYLFNYTGAFELAFYGDDDLFIFINGVLVLDLGGVHQRLPGRVQVNDAGVASTIEGGSLNGTVITACPGIDPMTMVATTSPADCRARTVNLNMTPGRTYEIAVFHADRHPSESNFQLTLSGFTTNRSECGPRCGDGTRTGAEECDCGETTPSADPSCGGKNNDGSYGGCTMDCKYGPYCGDGVMNGDEQCDLGSRDNNKTYGEKDGCAPGCKFPHFCGDAMVDEAEGEQCDLGPNNGGMGMACDEQCHIRVDI